LETTLQQGIFTFIPENCSDEDRQVLQEFMMEAANVIPPFGDFPAPVVDIDDYTEEDLVAQAIYWDDLEFGNPNILH
jgi:hypothetical protein